MYINIQKTEKMKTLKLLAVGIILLVSSSIQAQVSVNLNIGQLQPGVLQDMQQQNITITGRTSLL
jgi:hypothetical protein